MSDQITSASVGRTYDELITSFVDVLGGSLHFGFWDDSDVGQTTEDAGDRLTTLVAQRLDLRENQHILDVGCGTGRPAEQIARFWNVRVTGITVSQHQVDLAKGGMNRSGLTDYQLADITALSSPDASFDGAYAIECLIHIANKEAALANIARTLRPQTRLVIADIFQDEQIQESNQHLVSQLKGLFQVPSILTISEWRGLLQQAGFEQIDITDVRQHVLRRNFEITAEFLEQKAASQGGEIGEQIRAGSTIWKEMNKLSELGYALITATRSA